MPTSERVMIFIDGSNVYHSLKKYFGRTSLDFGKFCDKLLERRHLIRVYYYNAIVGKKEEPLRFVDQQKFFASLKTIPYFELRLARLVYNNWPASPPYEKGVDVSLATDMLVHGYRNNYDTAILVAGDNDYVGALQAVKDIGKHVEVALFGKEQTSLGLRDVADKTIEVTPRFLANSWKQPLPPQQPVAQRHRPQPQPLQPAQGQPPQPPPPAQEQPQPQQVQPQPAQQQPAPAQGQSQPPPQQAPKPARPRRHRGGQGRRRPPQGQPPQPGTPGQPQEQPAQAQPQPQQIPLLAQPPPPSDTSLYSGF